MKKLWILNLLIFTGILFAQHIVINEVMYDPNGSDSGNEWIELYNAGDQSVSLAGWMIQKAGTGFALVYTFDILSEYSIAPHSFFLIAEENIPNADITTNLAFQNGGSATDGVRIVSFDGLYTDTILYDSPNTNLLPGDENNPGIYFAPDVSSGNSLSRKHDGEDSDNCEQDFFECSDPTPGEPNFYPIDLAVQNPLITVNDEIISLFFEVANLSTENVDNYEALAEIIINSELFDNLELPEIPADDTIEVNIHLPEFNAEYNVIGITVKYVNDNELENNSVSVSFLNDFSPLVFNEILFKPSDNNCEWIEIYNRSASVYLVDNFTILDATDGEIRFFGEIQANDYLIICNDKNAFHSFYTEVPLDKIIEAVNWTSLNNNDEILTLYDNYGTFLEAVNYSFSNWETDISLERINYDLGSSADNWGPCIHGASPGVQNTIFVQVLPTKSALSVYPDPFSPQKHEYTIIYFKLPELISTVTIRVFDLKGRMLNKLLNQQLQASEGEFIWDGKDNNGHNLPVGVYIIFMEATSLADEKVYSETKTVVIGK